MAGAINMGDAPHPLGVQPVTDNAKMLRDGARSIVNDGTPSQVGPTADDLNEAADLIEELVAHIREQVIHAEHRIADGKELGASVWRIALEDIARENRALLAKAGAA